MKVIIILAIFLLTVVRASSNLTYEPDSGIVIGNYVLVKNTFDSGEVSNTTIYATFHNRYGQNLQFLTCIVSGKQVLPVKKILISGDSQDFIFEARFNPVKVSGHCYYRVPITSNAHVILDILFYLSTYWEQEYYGMTNSFVYDVHIAIPQSAHAVYYIY